MQKLPTNTLPGNERGATLIVALILLILISLIGVTSLKSAAVAERMSAAGHMRNITFQASESAATEAIRNTGLISQTIIADNSISWDGHTAVDNTAAEVVLTPVGASVLLGNSIGAGGLSGQRIMVNGHTRGYTRGYRDKH